MNSLCFPMLLRPVPWAVALCLLPAAQAQQFSGSISRNGVIEQEATGLYAEQWFSHYLSPWGDPPATGYHAGSFRGDASSGDSRVMAQTAGDSLTPAGTRMLTRLTFSQTVTNNSAAARALSFGFYIPGSTVGVVAGGSQFSGSATFSGLVTWGASTAWEVRYSVSGSATTGPEGNVLGDGFAAAPLVRSASAAGFSILDATESPLSVSSQWLYDPVLEEYVETPTLQGYMARRSESYNGNLDLGVLAAGETKTLTYTLEADAFYVNDRPGQSCAAYGGYGGCAMVAGNDPFGFNWDDPGPDVDAMGGPGLVFAPVPEPGSYALMLAGLAGVLALARRRRAA